MDQVLYARLCIIVLMGWRLHCSCSVLDEMRSINRVFVMNLVPLFWIFCNLDIWGGVSMFRGTIG